MACRPRTVLKLATRFLVEEGFTFARGVARVACRPRRVLNSTKEGMALASCSILPKGCRGRLWRRCGPVIRYFHSSGIENDQIVDVSFLLVVSHEFPSRRRWATSRSCRSAANSSHRTNLTLLGDYDSRGILGLLAQGADMCVWIWRSRPRKLSGNPCQVLSWR